MGLVTPITTCHLRLPKGPSAALCGVARPPRKPSGESIALTLRVQRLRQLVSIHRGQVVLIAWLAWLAGAVMLMLVPQRHEASASIFVNTQTVLKPMMVGLTYQPDIDLQVRMLARTLISRPNVGRLVELPDLAPLFAGQDKEGVVNRLMERIRIAAGDRGNLYTISYREPDAERARRVVAGLVSIFVGSGTDDKRRDTAEAGRFIDEQILATETKLVEAETRLKDFKVRHFGLSGVNDKDHFARLSSLSDEVGRIRTQLQAAERSRDTLKRELAAEDPHMPADTMPGTGMSGVAARQQLPSGERMARIEALRRQLDELRRRYTELAPDVAAVRQLLEQAEAEQAGVPPPSLTDSRAGRAPGAAATAGSAPTSPIYQKLRVSVAEAEAQVASLQAQLVAQQQRLAEARAVAGQMPHTEAELAQLNRDYDVVRKNYEQLVARRESAALGLRLDESAPLADFRVIEPPRVTPRPVFPARLHLGLALVVAVVFTAVLSAGIRQAVSPRVIDRRDLASMAPGRPLLGCVPDAAGPARPAMPWLLALVSLVMLQLIWLSWLAWRHAA
jgi:polysaccharide chain length determinant protein (PEP-CTERM system associated)